MDQLSGLYMTTENAIALILWAFVVKVMPLLYNRPSRFVIAFLPRIQGSFNFMTCSHHLQFLELKKRKSDTAPTFSLCVCHEVMGPDVMFLVFEC